MTGFGSVLGSGSGLALVLGSGSGLVPLPANPGYLLLRTHPVTRTSVPRCTGVKGSWAQQNAKIRVHTTSAADANPWFNIRLVKIEEPNRTL